MKPGTMSLQGQPKARSKVRTVSQTTPAPKIKGMAGFSKFGRVGGKVTPGVDKI